MASDELFAKKKEERTEKTDSVHKRCHVEQTRVTYHINLAAILTHCVNIERVF